MTAVLVHSRKRQRPLLIDFRDFCSALPRSCAKLVVTSFSCVPLQVKANVDKEFAEIRALLSTGNYRRVVYRWVYAQKPHV